ncbi:MAG TPA: hypothetical protein PLL77_15555 [Pyrinomonadaceae bacterium]|nr:hypothetical protein [Pyrinomonadaceae bacterium]
MKKTAIFLFVLCLSVAAIGQGDGITKKDLSQAEIDRIIKKVTENEGDFRAALTNYVFNRNATVNIIGLGGQIAGTFRRDSFMTFNQDGSRFEKVLFAPVATTPPGFVTPEDLEDLGGVNPFALEPAFVSQYNFSYLGVERIDELNLYVFEVRPKVIPDPKKSKMRLFTGRIWIDVDDLMIVKTKGKAVPETKTNKFPIVETYRDQVDGKYWFPIDARADDELVFDDGSVVRIRMRVKYTNYAVGRSEVRILDDVPDPKPTPTPTPKKPE